MLCYQVLQHLMEAIKHCSMLYSMLLRNNQERLRDSLLLAAAPSPSLRRFATQGLLAAARVVVVLECGCGFSGACARVRLFESFSLRLRMLLIN